MTNEEMIKGLKNIFSYYELDLPHTDSLEIMLTAIEALDKVEKYKWHDLRKNPDDFPTSENWVEVKAKMKCKWDNNYRLFNLQMTYKSKIMYGKPIGWGAGYPYDFNFETDEVVAWREIEPFEEVQE